VCYTVESWADLRCSLHLGFDVQFVLNAGGVDNCHASMCNFGPKVLDHACTKKRLVMCISILFVVKI
jgi:hypothetical protein